MLGVLLARNIATTDALMVGLYSDQPNVPEPHVLAVFVTHLRRKLKPYGCEIINHRGEGWSMTAAGKAKIVSLAAAEQNCP